MVTATISLKEYLNVHTATNVIVNDNTITFEAGEFTFAVVPTIDSEDCPTLKVIGKMI